MANIKIIEKKKQAVEDLVKRLEKAEIILITNYRGISVEKDTALRSLIREKNGYYQVVKNNIAKRAFEKLNIELDEEVFKKPTAIISADEDYLAVLKEIYKFSKENEFYIVKSGIIEGSIKTTDELKVLASLPSRKELMGMLAGTLLSTISKLAVAINEVKGKKENDSEVETEKTEIEENNKEETEESEKKEEENKE